LKSLIINQQSRAEFHRESETLTPPIQTIDRSPAFIESAAAESVRMGLLRSAGNRDDGGAAESETRTCQRLSDTREPKIGLAAPDDLEAILGLQKLAFRSEAELYNDFSIPPLTQTLESIQAEFCRKTFLKACAADVIVGSVRGFQKSSVCYVERLIVHPACQGRGIGKALMHALEDRFPDARRYELFTGHKSERNIHLYQKLGYSICRQEGMLVFMEKTADCRPARRRTDSK
jgi:ribosomal protein S18 acetylase RimI-like enzyme